MYRFLLYFITVLFISEDPPGFYGAEINLTNIEHMTMIYENANFTPINYLAQVIEFVPDELPPSEWEYSYTGVYLSPRTVLTANDCLDNDMVEIYMTRKVFGGSNKKLTYNFYSNVQRVIKNAERDIALIILEYPSNYTRTNMAELSDEDMKRGDEYELYGFGWDQSVEECTDDFGEELDKSSEFIQKTEVNFDPDDEGCHDYRLHSPFVSCVSCKQLNNICYMDCGGPVLKNGKVIALVSNGFTRDPANWKKNVDKQLLVGVVEIKPNLQWIEMNMVE